MLPVTWTTTGTAFAHRNCVRVEELHFSSFSPGPKCLLRDDTRGRPGMMKWSIRWEVTPMVRLKMSWWSNLAWSLPGQKESLENLLWMLAKAVARSHNYLPYASLSPSFIWGVYLIRQRGWSNFQLSETSACLCLSEPSTAPGLSETCPSVAVTWEQPCLRFNFLIQCPTC